MDYYKYCIKAKPEQTEILIALLSLQPFESFEETDEGFNAFIAAKAATAELDQSLNQNLQSFDYQLDKEFIPYQNWNALWESNFESIVIRDFCGIRADFHPSITNVQYELLIQPKMAFGTGHHETTYMVVDNMQKLPFHGAKVLDYGCGTGILAILASKLGAKHIDAIDIELASYENTMENAQMNQVNNIQAFHGTLDNILDADYDIILANINRNVILDSLPTLYQKLNPQGTLVVSGIILEDEDTLKDAAQQNHFTINQIHHKNNWICMLMQKATL